MGIIEALKQTKIRITYANRWLVWDRTLEAWVVYGREYAQKNTRTIVTTRNEEKAVKHLLYQEEA